MRCSRKHHAHRTNQESRFACQSDLAHWCSQVMAAVSAIIAI